MTNHNPNGYMQKDKGSQPEEKISMSALDAPTQMSQVISLFFSQNTIRLLVTIVAMLIVLRLTILNFTIYDALAILSAITIYLLAEWTIHAFILHLKPIKIGSYTFYPDAADRHRKHHMIPWDFNHIFLSPNILFFIPLVLSITLLTMPKGPALSFSFVWFILMLLYEWTHLIIHTRIQPQSHLAKTIFLNHQLHHFRSEQYWFSFYAPFIDKLLGTSPDPSLTHKSPNCFTLGYDPEFVSHKNGE